MNGYGPGSSPYSPADTGSGGNSFASFLSGAAGGFQGARSKKPKKNSLADELKRQARPAGVKQAPSVTQFAPPPPRIDDSSFNFF